MIDREKLVIEGSREYDIHLASAIGDEVITNTSDTFILAGSYAVEALVQRPIYHNGIDTNIFTTDIDKSTGTVESLLDKLSFEDSNLEIATRTEDRLEYRYQSKWHPFNKRGLKIQFVKFEEKNETPNNLEFVLQNDQNKLTKVPIVSKELTDSKGDEFGFSVKSLHYEIASWALRISGVALNPKREVYRTDIDNFMALYEQDPRNIEAIAKAMRYHPQVPGVGYEKRILFMALEEIRTKDL